MSSTWARWAPLAVGALMIGQAAGPALSQPTSETFPLGRSAASGAVCQAVRDFDDPATLSGEGRAWKLQCRGYAADLGRFYVLPAKQLSSWRGGLAGRGACEADQASAVKGLSGARLMRCQVGAAKTAYVALWAERGGRILIAEGLAPTVDVLETGLGVLAGAPVPNVTDTAQSVALSEVPGLAAGGLAAAEEAAASDPRRLRARGYVQNNEWRFDKAETDFRALMTAAEARDAPARTRAEAMLNLALNVSNNARFSEADALFNAADAILRATTDPVTSARAMNYRALHLRNQGKFADAEAMAKRAMEARAEIARRSVAPTKAANGDLVIDVTTALALNDRGEGTDVLDPGAPSLSYLLDVQDAQAWQIVGSARSAAGDAAGAREATGKALAIFDRYRTVGEVTAWLHARVLADLAELDLAQGKQAEAVAGFDKALAILRTRHAGSATEAAMTLDLARAQQAAGDTRAALATYDHAFEIFRNQRGSLGASADASAPYFDLLLASAAKEPANARAYQEKLFDAAETAVSSATAETVSRLAARVALGNDVTTGLARALDDTRRLAQAAESRVAALQADGAYEGAARVDADAELVRLKAQEQALETELFTLNPRYRQLVNSYASLAEVQTALKPDEVYSRILVLDRKSYGVLIGKGFIQAYPIDLSRAQVGALVTNIRAPLEQRGTLPPFDVAASRELFGKLFGPVQGQLMAAKHLIYEPSGALISLPAALLVTDDRSAGLMAERGQAAGRPSLDYRQVAWLGGRIDSSLVVSAASFLQSRAFPLSKATRPYLGYGDPVMPRSAGAAFATLLEERGTTRSGPLLAVCNTTRDALLQLSSLPETAAEVRAIGQMMGARPDEVVTGAAFTDVAVKNRANLDDYKVIYFATHGILPMPDACLPEPVLVTALGGTGSDALLGASELLDLHLEADLVVLSACDTGGVGSASAELGGLLGGGEALGGLTRALIYAGARGLLVTHWSIDSNSTETLMRAMFASGQPSQSEALKAAQLILQNDPRLSHPYYWAAFTVVGDGARPLPNSRPAPRVAQLD